VLPCRRPSQKFSRLSNPIEDWGHSPILLLVSPPDGQAARRREMKKNTVNKAQQKAKTPFFARFLEAQELDQASGGRLFQTMKYPSDSDEFVTLKYPSDGDDDVCK
jgi:hypothetical protein